MPILDKGRLVGVLSACGNGFNQDSAVNNTLSVNHMEQLLTHLASLIEDKLSSLDESEKLAEELAKSFEDLNLYSRIATQVKTLRFSPVKLEELNKDLLDLSRLQVGTSPIHRRQG